MKLHSVLTTSWSSLLRVHTANASHLVWPHSFSLARCSTLTVKPLVPSFTVPQRAEPWVWMRDRGFDRGTCLDWTRRWLMYSTSHLREKCRYQSRLLNRNSYQGNTMSFLNNAKIICRFNSGIGREMCWVISEWPSVSALWKRAKKAKGKGHVIFCFFDVQTSQYSNFLNYIGTLLPSYM